MKFQNANVPQGNTQRSVNLQVCKLINPMIMGSKKILIDVPCGKLELSRFLVGQYEDLKIIGIDKFAPNSHPTERIEFIQGDAVSVFRERQFSSVDVITCISGVMCFDNVEALIQHFHLSLKPGGQLVLTNDNFLTVRDRFHFLLFGHVKRFKLFYEVDQGMWNILFPQTLMMLLKRHGFQKIEIKYTSYYLEDMALFPFALLIYACFLPYLLLSKSSLSFSSRLKLFPFQMLFARHYVMSASKETESHFET